MSRFETGASKKKKQFMNTEQRNTKCIFSAADWTRANVSYKNPIFGENVIALRLWN